MGASEWSTHQTESHGDHVTKRFPVADGARAGREWRALTLLATHAPGLAPEPWTTGRGASGPYVVMSRLPGTPLRGGAVTGVRLSALCESLNELYAAVPAEVLKDVPARPGRQRDLVAHLAGRASASRPRTDGPVRRAMDAGLEWLAASGMATGEGTDTAPVFGPGDGNLANYLWDGTRVRVVDFEESGRSDRPFELAEITEHVSCWVDHPLDVHAFLAGFELSAAETARLGECRRLLALVWLFLLADDKEGRNPAGTAERQAERLRALLG